MGGGEAGTKAKIEWIWIISTATASVTGEGQALSKAAFWKKIDYICK